MQISQEKSEIINWRTSEVTLRHQQDLDEQLLSLNASRQRTIVIKKFMARNRVRHAFKCENETWRRCGVRADDGRWRFVALAPQQLQPVFGCTHPCAVEC
jgi:hypothetical protein